MAGSIARVGLTALLLALGVVWAGIAEAQDTKEGVSPLIRSAHSGAWSSPSTWQGGQVPAAGSRVQIRGGHRVLYDVQSTSALRALFIAGTLAFAPDRDTRLDVGLIRIQSGDETFENGFDCDAHLTAPDSSEPRAVLEVGTPA